MPTITITNRRSHQGAAANGDIRTFNKAVNEDGFVELTHPAGHVCVFRGAYWNEQVRQQTAARIADGYAKPAIIVLDPREAVTMRPSYMGAGA